MKGRLVYLHGQGKATRAELTVDADYQRRRHLVDVDPQRRSTKRTKTPLA